MKRFILIIAAGCLLFSIAACTPAIERFRPSLSELRDNVYEAASEQYSVSIITGKREDPFLMDGHAGGMREFTVITVDPSVAPAKLSYSIVIGGSEYTGDFLPHPFARTYSADIAAMSHESELSLVVTADGQSETLTVKSVKTEQMINAEKAVEIAERKLKSRIDSFRVGSELNCEIYVRLIANPVDNSGGYHWYVAFIGENQTIYAVLIEPVSMQIVAIRD